MAHCIDQSTGKAAVFVTGTAAWHRLGTVVTSAQTSADAINLAGLNWQVEQWPITATSGATTIDVPRRVANVRSDTHAVLGVVGEGYNVLQNDEAFSFMDSLVNAKLAMYETAGALNGGRRVWIMARIPGELKATDADRIIPYALLCNGHDGSLAIHVKPTTVRVVCRNTQNLALRENTAQLTIRHSDSMKGKVEQARKVLGLINLRMQSFQSEIDALRRVSMTDTQVTDYARTVFKIKPARAKTAAAAPKIDDAALLNQILAGRSAQEQQQADNAALVESLILGDKEATARKARADAQLLDQILANFHDKTNTLPGIEGTAWAAYNAVSEYADHQARVTGRTQSQKDNNRLTSIWFGRSDKVKQLAYTQALKLAN